jgi:hypothetical protein
MPTALDTPADRLDDGELNFVRNIREFGWFRTGILAEGARPGFAYTTGFWSSLGSPEILVFALAANVTHTLLWNLYRELKDGRLLTVGQPLGDVFGSHSAYLFPVSKDYYPDHLSRNLWFYGGNDFPYLQLVWPDRQGVFPWEPDFDEGFRKDQPDLSPGGWSNQLTH